MPEKDISLPDVNGTEPGFLGRVSRSARVVWSRWKREPNIDLQPLHSNRLFVMISLLIIAGTGISMFVFDAGLSTRLRALPDSVVGFFKVFTELGQSAWMIVVACIASVYFASTKWSEISRVIKIKKTRLHADFTFFLAVIVTSGILARVAKGAIGRSRPNNSLGEGSLHFEFLAFSYEFSGFPSGHATTFGAACMVLALYASRWRIPLVVLALTGGISRVITGWHYSSDVIAGLAFGALIALVAARYWARRNVMFKVPEGGFIPIRKKSI